MKRLQRVFCLILAVAALTTTTFAHSGRTDAQGGHRDTKNASGLGSYHYHHGYGPHLHTGGVCPYATAPATGSSAPTDSTQSSTQGSSATTPAETEVSDSEKAKFLDTYIAIIQTGQSVYHKLDCGDLDIMQGFTAYNVTAAESEGYTPCSSCHPLS